MRDDMNEDIEFEPDFETDDEIEFEPDEGFDDIEYAGTGRSRRLDEIKARGRQALHNAADRGRERIYDAAERGRGRLATAIDSAAGRVDQRLHESADYLRTHDVDGIRQDLSNQIRRHPLLSAGVALGAGYLIGRVLVDSGPRRGRRGHSGVGRQLSRALVSGVGAMLTARVRDSLARRPPSQDVIDDDY